MALVDELAALIGSGNVIAGDSSPARAYLGDETESRALSGSAAAIALPDDAEGVRQVTAWCYAHDVAIVPRGGGSGFSGGAVPSEGSVVIGVERLTQGLEFETGSWRVHVPAGTITAALREQARKRGFYYPPDPGSQAVSLIGGNIATNAGGPHTFKYGVTGSWVSGLEVVLAPGELVQIGGRVRKDVGGYDLRSLLIGSEGTLGIVTGAWMKLIPAPEAALPVVGFYPSTEAGQAAILNVLASGVAPAAVEFLDAETMEAALPTLGEAIPGLPPEVTGTATFVVIAEADGSSDQVARDREDLIAVMQAGAQAVHAPAKRAEVSALWLWRDVVSRAVTAREGGKVSEDIVVPVERIAETVRIVHELGARHRVPTCNWGHAGDGNIHANFMVNRNDEAGLARAAEAAHELFEFVTSIGGAVSGEHGIGIVKNHMLALQWPSRALDLHAQVKRVFDPKGLFNPGKKLAR
jgi:glycolate oxidase subunit GlcD